MWKQVSSDPPSRTIALASSTLGTPSISADWIICVRLSSSATKSIKPMRISRRPFRFLICCNNFDYDSVLARYFCTVSSNTAYNAYGALSFSRGVTRDINCCHRYNPTHAGWLHVLATRPMLTRLFLDIFVRL